MGEYFVIVNPAKRQYLDAFHFGESIKVGGILRGQHGAAVALLICDEAGSIPPLGGTWVGDPVIATGDSAPPNSAGIPTASATDPQRNLYRMAQKEFEDISLPAIAMLCQRDPEVATDFATRARQSAPLL